MLRWKIRTQRYGSQMWVALCKLELPIKFLISFGNYKMIVFQWLGSYKIWISSDITDASCPSCAIKEICLGHQFVTYNLTCVIWFRSPLTIGRYLSQSEVIIVLLLGWKECIKHKVGAITSLYSFNNLWAIWIYWNKIAHERISVNDRFWSPMS